MKKITNKHINDFLEESGYYPAYEIGEECYYTPSRDFYSLLDRYYIQYIAIPNKL